MRGADVVRGAEAVFASPGAPELAALAAGGPGTSALVGGGLVLLAVAALGAVLFLRRRHRVGEPPPPVVFRFDGETRAAPRRSARPHRPPAHDAAPRRPPEFPATGAGQPRDAAARTSAPGTGHAPGRAPPSNGPPPEEEWSRVDAGPVRFHEPPEGTLQLLPGRLEVVSGAGQGEEVRFVRVPGADPEFTFGRTPGPPHRHVQLDSPTVSRVHATLRCSNGRWFVRNRSSTNPTVVNGRPLASEVEEVPLEDGDHLEMGEVAFVLRLPRSRDRLAHRSSWYTDKGRRPRNEDAVVVRTLPDGRELAAVCDGLGGQQAGKHASHLALEALVKALEGGDGLRQAVQAANRAVVREAEADPSREGMGTTLVALLRDGDHYEIANVGDSRAYRLTSRGTEQVTADHSFVAEAVREGRMGREEARRSPWGNAVTRTLGAEASVDVDIFDGFSAGEPHLVVLTSDGVHEVLSEAEMERVLRSAATVGDAARELAEEALGRGSDDNVAAAVLQFGGWSPAARARSG